MMRTNKSLRAWLLGVAASAALVACGGGGGDGPVAPAASASPQGGAGTLRVALTDAPTCGFDQVNVTVERVRVHQSSTAGDNDGGWTDILVSPGPRKINLLTLQNGAIEDLGQSTLPAGQYTQMRLVLVPNSRTNMANTVKPTGQPEMEMATPSATQSGLKLINGFTIEANKVTYIVLDFDACKSVVQRGNGTYGLKPVIHMMAMSASRIAGWVPVDHGDVTVSAQKNGVIVKSTQPDSAGRFVLAPLDPSKSPYDVVFTAYNRTTSVIASVPVAADQQTTLGSETDRVTVPGSLYGEVSGNLAPAAARDTGSVRALQTVGAQTTVEVAHRNVDALTGDYSLRLPTDPPRLLAWSNPMVWPLNFQPQNAYAGKYRLEASANGYQTQLGSEITVTSGSLLGNQNFTLQTP